MEKIEHKVYESIGHASMAWSEMPKGIFDDKLATKIAKDLISEIKKLKPIKMSAIEFVKEKLAHLKQFYKDEEEFVAHLLEEGKSEVTMPVRDVIKWIEEIINRYELPFKDSVPQSESTSTTTTTV